MYDLKLITKVTYILQHARPAGYMVTHSEAEVFASGVQAVLVICGGQGKSSLDVTSPTTSSVGPLEVVNADIASTPVLYMTIEFALVRVRGGSDRLGTH